MIYSLGRIPDSLFWYHDKLGCSFLSTINKFWDDARDYCKNLGGDLANINVTTAKQDLGSFYESIYASIYNSKTKNILYLILQRNQFLLNMQNIGLELLEILTKDPLNRRLLDTALENKPSSGHTKSISWKIMKTKSV